MRKPWKFLLLALAAVALSLAVVTLLAGPSGRVTITLHQTTTNNTGDVVHTFKLHNGGWDCTVKAQRITQMGSVHGVQEIPLHAVNAAVLKKGESAVLTCAHSAKDTAHLVVDCAKANASPLYKRLTSLNERLHGELPFVPVIFRHDQIIALDLNAELTSLR